MTYCNNWFHDRTATGSLPPECVSDCTGPGPADEAVAYWVRQLDFDGPAWLIREHLSGYGAWDSSELCDHQANLRRLLWTWACNCREFSDYNYPLYLSA